MSRPEARKITNRTVASLRAERKPGLFWDRDLPGFGVRVYTTGKISYVVQSRGPGGSRRVTLGRHGEITPHAARKLAAQVIDRIKTGLEPLPERLNFTLDQTIEELGKQCLERYVDRQCKPATAEKYRLLLRVHILPALGKMSVRAVQRKHIAALHHAMREKPAVANHTLAALSRMFSLAETWGWRPEGSNPCRSIRAYRSKYRERFLNREEYRRIGQVLRDLESKGTIHRPAITAIRLLMLTGCRSGEIATLRWDDVDRASGYLRLRDSKTGPRQIPLTQEMLAVLDSVERLPNIPWVFNGVRAGTRMGKLHRYWSRLRKKADMEDVRLHDLRHSFASRALHLGESLTMIGRLLGHSSISTTARYAHLVKDTEKASAARVAGSIEANIFPEDAEIQKSADLHKTTDKKELTA